MGRLRIRPKHSTDLKVKRILLRARYVPDGLMTGSGENHRDGNRRSRLVRGASPQVERTRDLVSRGARFLDLWLSFADDGLCR